VIVAGLPTKGVVHNGGALAFGPDDKLYWGIGDNGSFRGVNDDLSSLAAKISRVSRDGTAPNDNPFFDGDGSHADPVWARGFRNPFRMTFRPETGDLWIGVPGTYHEQAFVVGRGDHAGYRQYENDQPPGYLAPVIAYRTNSAWSPTVVTAAREDGVATFTTVQPHGFRPGQKLTVSVASTPSFAGTVYVSSTPDATTLTAAQPGPNITGTGGSLNAQRLGGCLIGGTFYDATLFPASERGGYFFADFNSQSLVRSVPSGRTTVSSTDLWRYVGSEPVDL
jgi:hypothetical protein